jgi:cytochrome c-type biogenesis protein CcmE
MAQTTWEKSADPVAGAVTGARSGRWKLIVGGIAILGAIVYLIISGTSSGARYFISINDLLSSSKYAGQTVRITGAVIGDTIRYDTEKLIIDFTMVDFPQDSQDLALALHTAVGDTKAAHIVVHLENQVKPDLLKNEAQAIVTGKLDANGVFQASELLLKCPSHYEEADEQKALASSVPGK